MENTPSVIWPVKVAPLPCYVTAVKKVSAVNSINDIHQCKLLCGYQQVEAAMGALVEWSIFLFASTCRIFARYG